MTVVGSRRILLLPVTLCMQDVVLAELSRWEGYVQSDPERVLAAIRLRYPTSLADGSQVPNEWGDTYKVRGRVCLGRFAS